MRTSAATQAASLTRKDTGMFNHNAALALADQTTMTRQEIASFLGISLRTVHHLLATPCGAYAQERQDVRRRQMWERLQRTKRGSVPIFLELATEADIDEDVRRQMVDWEGLSTREKVGHYLRDGFPQAKMARLLGVSRQAVSKHVAGLSASVKSLLDREEGGLTPQPLDRVPSPWARLSLSN